MVEIELDIKKSIDANASEYFEKAKKCRKKMKGALDAVEKAKKRLSALSLETEERKKKMAQEKEEKKKREEEKKGRAWYEKFRWFISSEGFIVIAGRDSTTNDIIVKKHMEKDDIVFHTNIAGSPFTIIKTEGKIPGEETKREAAIETASFSRAWKMGISEAEVFQVNPEQVSSSVKSGEYMGKGAFMIYGKRNTMHAEVKLGIGLYDGRIMCAPLSAVRKHCKKLLIITQGSEKKTSAAKLIKKEIGGEIDDIVSALPPGEVKVSKQE